MKGMFKRALAGVAAAAFAATGLALGAGAASAAPAGQTITITGGGAGDGVVDGHSFKYVEIASYVADNEDNPTNAMTTVDAVKNAVTQAVNAVFNPNTVPDGADPLVWAQGVSGDPMGDNTAFPWYSDARSRQFADKLVELLDTEGYTDLWTSAGPADKDGLTIENLDGGLYLIVDTTQHVTDATATLPMLVGTKNTAIGDYVDGTVVVKNQKTSTPPTKTVDGDKNGTVTQGQTLDFTIEGKVPATAGAAEDYEYVFADYANSGISIDLSTLKVSYENTEGKMTDLDEDLYVVDPDDQTTVTGDDVNFDEDSANDEATFTVSVPKATLDALQQSAGRKLVVTYTATVTTTTTTVNNKATVTNGQMTSQPGKSPELTSTPIEFTKNDENGKALAGASFKIETVGENTPALPGSYAKTATSDKDGKVRFAGLADGTYKITETQAPEDYMGGVTLPSFTVTIEGGKITGITGDAFKLVTWNDDFSDIKVKNVKNVTQLPMTGAAGTALFTVLGLLIAGAGALAYMKSRNVKHALRG